MENKIDPNGICLDFVSYSQAMEESMLLFFKKHDRNI
jgi:hypothetical protein